MKIGIIVLVIIVVLLAAWIISLNNKLVKLRNMVETQWSQVDVQLKRRFDLIPNLVESVKAYAKHEQETLELVVKSRNMALNAKAPEETMEADKELSGALNRLLAITEAYPELKADSSFKELQNNLRDAEDKIAYARQFYNDTVLKYQNAMEVFPANLIAPVLGFKEAKYFEVAEAEKENVKVQF